MQPKRIPRRLHLVSRPVIRRPMRSSCCNGQGGIRRHLDLQGLAALIATLMGCCLELELGLSLELGLLAGGCGRGGMAGSSGAARDIHGEPSS